MKYIRYFKKFDNWMGCAYKAQAGAFGFEYGEDRRVLYQYIFYGSVKYAKSFSSESITISEKGKLVDVKEFLDTTTIFSFQEDTFVFGFNTIDGGDWDGELVSHDEIKSDKESVLICLEGNPIVNNTKIRRFDYDELTIGKKYNIDLNGGVLALFKKL